MYAPLSNERMASAVITALWILFGIVSISLGSDLLEFNLLRSSSEGIDLADAEANDTRQIWVSITQLLFTIITIVLFLLWFSRAYSNLHAVNKRSVRYSKGWAAGSWFVPFVNLVMPYKIMKEVWYKTQEWLPNNSDVEDASYLGVWWALFILATIAGRIYSVMERGAETINELVNLNITSIMHNLIFGIFIIFTILIVRKIRTFESQFFNHFAVQDALTSDLKPQST
jgi:hypothetical protein